MTCVDPEGLISPVVARSPLLPVATVTDADMGAPLAQALVAGGVPLLEITLRTAASLEALRRAASVPGAVVGAGTCLTVEDLHKAKDAGAAFAVSPGVRPDLLEAAAAMRLPYLPGVATPSEVMTALAHGHRTLKLFPAEPAGGVAYLRALAGPFAGVRFCPTGGVTQETAPQLLAEPNVACVGGSWMAPPRLMLRGEWSEIERLAAESVRRLNG